MRQLLHEFGTLKVGALALGGILLASVTYAQPVLTAFESGPVRPLAMSPDGARIFVTNIPDNRLEIFSVDDGELSLVASVAVGLEPVAVVARDDGEVWVVNHLSDSISVVDVASSPPRVVRTLWVGDEPRDIVFAGPGRSRAFVTTAHRGQNIAFDPQLTTPGVGRADVWVFDADEVGAGGGDPLTVVTLFGDTPRALAVSPDGATVYAAVFHSGNQTTVLNEEIVCSGGEDAICRVDGVVMPGGLPGPDRNVEGATRPEVGMIVKLNRDSGAWEDTLGRDWSEVVRFNLPDYDVFAIDAAADPPVESAKYPHVGTILFNMVTNPVTGALYVSNTEARNEVRFEGAGASGHTTVLSHLHEARITIVEPSTGDVTPRHLNPHIDYSVVPSPAGVMERSLATPLEMVMSADGSTIYLAAFGSAAIGVIDVAELEAGTRDPGLDDRIELSGGGPSGMVLDQASDSLYVLTRLDNTVTAIDLSTGEEVQRIALHNPEPSTITEGRRFLYDARFTSSNGEASCSACHVFGDVDDLAWNLGDPDGESVLVGGTRFHPMKGPMTVQTLRGLADHGAMHWRGERNGAVEPGGDRFDERAAFRQFNGAFVSLLGRDSELTENEMEAYADFVLRIIQPPNPVRSLDNELNAMEAEGKRQYFGTSITCNLCHTLDADRGLFGTNGTQSTSLETQEFKTPQLRNMYQRVGMFGVAPIPMFGGGNNTSHQGDQIRGFGYIHDGSLDTLSRFLSAGIFGLSENQRREVEAYLLAFDSNLAPVVGQQVSIGGAASSSLLARLDLLIARAGEAECEVVAHGVADGIDRGWYYDVDSRVFVGDRGSDAPRSKNAMIAAATTDSITFTCVPPGSGERIGVDRDGDGIRDRDEIDEGSDPADASSPAPICAGDCDGDGLVSIGELIRAVSIALGENATDLCPAIDGDRDRAVAISELIAAVRNALASCAR